MADAPAADAAPSGSPRADLGSPSSPGYVQRLRETTERSAPFGEIEETANVWSDDDEPGETRVWTEADDKPPQLRPRPKPPRAAWE